MNTVIILSIFFGLYLVYKGIKILSLEKRIEKNKQNKFYNQGRLSNPYSGRLTRNRDKWVARK